MKSILVLSILLGLVTSYASSMGQVKFVGNTGISVPQEGLVLIVQNERGELSGVSTGCYGFISNRLALTTLQAHLKYRSKEDCLRALLKLQESTLEKPVFVTYDKVTGLISKIE